MTNAGCFGSLDKKKEFIACSTVILDIQIKLLYYHCLPGKFSR